MSTKTKAPQRKRIGRVSVYLHHGQQHIYYRDCGAVIRQAVGTSLPEAEAVASIVNARLAAEVAHLGVLDLVRVWLPNAPASASMTTTTKLADLQCEFLAHHESALESSRGTINRYRTATDHLVRYAGNSADPTAINVAAFVIHLRKLHISPNGHPNTQKRGLRDKGLQYVLQTCRSMLKFGHRHGLIAESLRNPFSVYPIGRIVVRDRKPIFVFNAKEEEVFFRHATGQAFAIHMVLAKTGQRPAELTHTFIEDIDLDGGWWHIRSKPELGWTTKTNRERSVPLVDDVVHLLKAVIGNRDAGLVFIRKAKLPWARFSREALGGVVVNAVKALSLDARTNRAGPEKVQKQIWRDAGLVDTDQIRLSFIRIAQTAMLPSHATCPKSWRHTFATLLQQAKVDPLIRPGNARSQALGSGSGCPWYDRLVHPHGPTDPARADRDGVAPASAELVTHQRCRRRDEGGAVMNRPPIIAKAEDGVLHVAFNGRISTESQDIGNIEASFIPLNAVLNDLWMGQVKIEKYGEQSSGLNIDRPEMIRLNKQIKTGTLDLLMSEDLGRLYRDPGALWGLLDNCGKYKVRVICPGDDLDTANDNWRKTAHSAISSHCGFIDDTRRRLKRTASKRFPEGGLNIHVIPGYEKITRAEASARSDDPGLQLRLIEEYRSVVDDIRRKVVFENYSYARLAEYLNAIGFKPGPYVQSDLWSGLLVKTWLRNPLLCGWRRRSVNLYGRDEVSKEPTITPNDAPTKKYHTVLAFMTEAEFDEMQRVLDGYGNGQAKGEASGAARRRTGVARRDTLFPRQQLVCKFCDGYFYDAAANGLRCCNSLRRSRTPCWCHVQMKVAIVVAVLVDFLLGMLQAGPPCVMQRFMTAAFETLQQLQSNYSEEIARLRTEIKSLTASANNWMKCAGKANTDTVQEKFIESADASYRSIKEAEQRIIAVECAVREERRPQTVEDLMIDPRSALLDLAASSFEFGDLMRRIMPKIFVQPIQAIDSGLVRARLEIKLDLSSYGDLSGDCLLVEHHVVDAFEPAQPFADRAAVVAARDELAAAGCVAGAAAAGRKLGIGKTRATRALNLHAFMLKVGLTEPYRVLSEPPSSASRWKKRQKAKPLEHGM